MNLRHLVLGGLAGAGLLLGAATHLWSVEAPEPESRASAKKLMDDGNFKDAYNIYHRLALDPMSDPKAVPGDLTSGIHCLRNLGQIDEADELLEAAIAAHSKNWRLLAEAANQFLGIDHYGQIVGNEFTRGNRRGGGPFVSTIDRDRTRALQLLVQARELAVDNPRDEFAQLHHQLAGALMFAREGDGAWKLQELTDLAKLPDYDPNGMPWGFRRGWGGGGSQRGAPVDEQGNPIYYQVPESWEKARNDGERWRFALTQVGVLNPARLGEVEFQFGNFCESQFGVETLATFGFFVPRDAQAGAGDEGDEKDNSGTYALHTLTDDETIARLAIGIRRFKLPDEFNPIKIFERIAARREDPQADSALVRLASDFTNRRQYVRAAEYWRRSIAEHGETDVKKQALAQIVANWGRFEGLLSQPAGRGATIDYRFRNGALVHFKARPIKIEQLLQDIKKYLKSNPNQLDWQRLQIEAIGYQLVQGNQQQYLGDVVADWKLELKPRPEHLDDRVTVTTPLQKAGAYLLTAEMEGGNTTDVIVWLNDTALVKKPLSDAALYYVADAVSGAPIEKANVEFFGYEMKNDGNRRATIVTSNFALFSDANGIAQVTGQRVGNNMQWLVMARTQQGRLAFMGFQNVWYNRLDRWTYDEIKVLTITDRPIYRPKQKVQFKFWVRHPRYDEPAESEFAGAKFKVIIADPQGNQVLAQEMTADEFGGLAGEYELPEGAKLGQYSLFIENRGGGGFRVEEYKKPEYEVTVDAPTEPIKLGDKFTATVNAKYYFGSPVTEATVKYRVIRTPHTERWFPVGPWDWLYGPGYSWLGGDYGWYPGFARWGCFRPIPPWWGFRPQQPPEVVMEQELPIGPDGTLKIEIDSAPAKALHGDEDHRYEITAEVVDASRRTVVGSGSVLATRKPFTVTAWVDRGYYRVGDTIEASFAARTLDGRPVAGTAVVDLLAISYDDKRQPVETKVQSWELTTDAEGYGRQQMSAAKAGQYRLAVRVTDAAGHAIEGGYVFLVRGDGFDGREFRFNDLEIVPNKKEYAPGEKLELMVNTNRPDGTVLIFFRPVNGTYPAPQVVRLKGKSTVVTTEIAAGDMPNFFVEAVTVADARVHQELREIIVPPVKRIAKVEVLPSASEYLPGAEAKVQLRLLGLDGKPFVGSTVVAVYDKAVDAIAGGSNVPDIREFFWSWRRHHYPQTNTNLGLFFPNMVPKGQVEMQNLGIFGESVVEETKSLVQSQTLELRDAMTPAAPAPMAEAAAAPAADGAPGMRMMKAGGGGGGAEPNGPGMVQPSVRKEFADTAYWAAALAPNSDGVVEVALKMPENLTTWKIRTWSMGAGTQVGQGDAEVITRKNLIVRLQAPRFFVERDEVVLSANVHNYLKTEKSVEVSLELDGQELSALDETTRTVTIAAGGEARVDWRVKAVREGQAVIRMKALTDEESDAVEQRFAVKVHGILKTETVAGAMRPEDESAKIEIKIPDERRVEESRLEIHYSPSLAYAMVDALPYLAEYPYGCTEQTLNRFLPAVITQRVLIDMGLDLKAIGDKRTNLNAQELGDAAERAKQWKRWDRNPVFDDQELARMVADGLQKLTEMQLSDGGWGWFSGWGEHSAPHTTATVVHGLQIAAANGVALVPGVMENGVEWLKRYQAEQVVRLKNAATKTDPWKPTADDLDALVYMVLADADVADAEMRDLLYRDRVGLSVYSKAMFALAMHKQQQADKLAMLMQNIEQFVEEDDENQTAWLQLPQTWWYWYGSEYEALAYYLKLLAKTDPKGERASRVAKYLLNNRKNATWWNSTRDTALCVEALADFVRASGEDKPEMTVEIWIDGKQNRAVEITPANIFQFDNRVVLEGEALTSGPHTIEIRKRGRGPLYFNAYTTNFTLEDHITAAGLEVKVQRKVYKLVPEEATATVEGSRGQAVGQKVQKYRREELTDPGQLTSGDLVEIELVVESKNDYEYVVFEDMKAAGCEPVELLSGYTGSALGAYVEMRDDRAAFFVRALPRGQHSLTYRLRAEIPGHFSALPAKAAAMYAPELRGNSDEIKLDIADRKE